MVHGHSHVIRRRPDHHDVVVVGRAGRGQRPRADAEAGHEGGGAVGVLAVALHHAHQGHIGVEVGNHPARLGLQHHVAALAHEDLLGQLDGQHLHRAVGQVGAHHEIFGCGRSHGERAGEQTLAARRLQVHSQLAVSGDDLPAGHHHRHPEVAQVLHEQDVGVPARRDRADHVVDPVGLGTVDGGHLDGRHRVDAGVDSHAHHVVDVAPVEHVAGHDIVGAEAHPPARTGCVLQHETDVLLQEVREGRLADHHVHAVAELLEALVGVVALVVEADPGARVAGEVGAGGHRRAAEHGQAVLAGDLHGLEHVGVAGGDELAHGLPHAHALGPPLSLPMVVGAEVVAHGGGGQGVGGLAGSAPQDPQRGALGLPQECFGPVQPGHHQDLVQARDHVERAQRHQHLGRAGDRQLRALQVLVAVEQPRNEVASLRLDDAGVVADVGRHVADSHHGVAVDGHVGRVDLGRHDIDEPPAADDGAGRDPGRPRGHQIRDRGLGGHLRPPRRRRRPGAGTRPGLRRRASSPRRSCAPGAPPPARSALPRSAHAGSSRVCSRGSRRGRRS